MRRTRLVAGVLALAVLGGAARGETTAAKAAPTGLADIVAEVVRSLANCGEACRTEKGLSAEVWNLRKRVATTEDLRSMAVQVEQGEESCLCGKTSPTATEVEKQGVLLAEAILLWHLAGDTDGVRYNTQRLRNVVAQVAGKPEEPGLMELLVRAVAIAGGESAKPGKVPDSGKRYGEIALWEVAGVKPDAMRVGVLIGAAGSGGVETEARRILLRDAAKSWAALPTEVRAEKPGMAIRLAGELAEVGLEPELAALLATLPDAIRLKATTSVERARSKSSPVAPVAAASGGLAEVAEGAATLAKGAAPAKDVAAKLSATPPEARVWVAMRAAERSGATATRALEIAAALPAGPIRVAWLAGAGKGMSAGGERLRYEDVLVVRGGG